MILITLLIIELIIWRKVIFRYFFACLKLIVSFLLFLLIIFYCFIINLLWFLTKWLILLFLNIRLGRWLKIILKFMTLSFIKVIVLFGLFRDNITDLLFVMKHVFNLWWLLFYKIPFLFEFIQFGIKTKISFHQFDTLNSVANILNLLNFMFECGLLKLWCWYTRKIYTCRFNHLKRFLFTFWNINWLLEKVIL